MMCANSRVDFPRSLFYTRASLKSHAAMVESQSGESLDSQATRHTTYLLLYNKLLPNRYLSFYRFCGLRPKHNLPRCLWLKFSHKVTTKLFSGTLVSSEDSAVGREYLPPSSLRFAGRPWSLATCTSLQDSLITQQVTFLE